MRFVCENCLAQYMINDEKIKPQGVRVRCKKCSHVMTLRPPAFEADLALPEEATIRMPLPEEEEDEEAFFMDAVVQSGEYPLPSLGDFGEEGFPLAADKEKVFGNTWPKSTEEGALSSASPADLGSLFDDPELKSPSASGLFGALDDEELGDAFERAISQRPTSNLSAGAFVEPSIVVSQGLQPAGVEWFVAIDDQQVGPLDMRGLKAHWQQGKIGRDSLCWKSGMRDWLPIGTVEGLFEQLNVLSAVAASAEFSLPSESSAAHVAWQPAAASALASLVQDELHGMTASPPLPVGPPSGAPAPYSAVAALSDIPSPAAPASSPTYGTVLPVPTPAPVYAASLSMPPAPSPYLPPAPPPSASNKAMWAMAAALLLFAGTAITVMLVVVLRSPATPASVAQMQLQEPTPTPPTPPAPPPPPPPVVEVPVPVVEPSPEDSSAVLAQQLLPSPAQRSTKASNRTSKTAPPASGGGVAPAPAPRASTGRGGVQDDFERAFGVAGADSAPTKGPGSKAATVYVPPPPGGGAVRQALSDTDIKDYIISKRAEVAKCAREQKSKNPNIKGDMVLEWNIATSGRTSQVRLATPSAFQGTYFADCVIKLVQSWQFPAHRTAGGTRRFNFKI